MKGGKVLGNYPDSFEKGPDNDIILSRGRVVPTTPWDGEYDSVAFFHIDIGCLLCI